MMTSYERSRYLNPIYRGHRELRLDRWLRATTYAERDRFVARRARAPLDLLGATVTHHAAAGAWTGAVANFPMRWALGQGSPHYACLRLYAVPHGLAPNLAPSVQGGALNALLLRALSCVVLATHRPVSLSELVAPDASEFSPSCEEIDARAANVPRFEPEEVTPAVVLRRALFALAVGVAILTGAVSLATQAVLVGIGAAAGAAMGVCVGLAAAARMSAGGDPATP